MLVTRYNPVNDIRRSFDLFNSIVNSVEKSRDESSMVAFIPAVNTREGDDAYYVEVDLPGIKKEDIDIDVENNVLTISGERKVKNEVKEEDYYKLESSYGKFSRSFTLPEKVNTDKIQAQSKNGVLEVVVPKLKEQEKKAKKIKVK
jgi:HSP20 family protein